MSIQQRRYKRRLTRVCLTHQRLPVAAPDQRILADAVTQQLADLRQISGLVQMRMDQPKDGDPDIKRLAHTLKGSVRSLGMFALAELAARIDAERRAGGAPDARQQAELLTCLQNTLARAQETLDQVSAEMPAAPERPVASARPPIA